MRWITYRFTSKTLQPLLKKLYYLSKFILGRSQVVRQRVLIPSCVGSNPPGPATMYYIVLASHIISAIITIALLIHGTIMAWHNHAERLHWSMQAIALLFIGTALSGLGVVLLSTHIGALTQFCKNISIYFAITVLVEASLYYRLQTTKSKIMLNPPA